MHCALLGANSKRKHRRNSALIALHCSPIGRQTTNINANLISKPMSVTMNSIAKREVTDLALVKRTVAPNATDDQLAMFLHDCERRGVHPLDKLIVFTNAGGKYTPITTIDFVRPSAADSGDMAGSDDAVFTITAGKPESATVTVYRLTNGARYAYAATARLKEYYRNTPTWNHMPHTMLAKCAEALALRK